MTNEAKRRFPPLSAMDRFDVLRYEKSLAAFSSAGWHWAREPDKYKNNWHIDLICDYLTAVVDLDSAVKGPLIINIPPRHMKSIGVNVFLPAWLWAQDPDPDKVGHRLGVRPGTLRGPGVKLAYISYSQDLSNEHSMKCRDLIDSDWYQARWGNRYTVDSSRIEWFNNNWGGDRRSMSFTGKVTGFGADLIVVDDPHNLINIDSSEVREETLRRWDEVLPSRLNEARGMFIIIMQRSHERDLVGHILAKEFNGTHVCLPAEYEAKHPHVFLTSKVKRETVSPDNGGGPVKGDFWADIRKEGEVLWKNRFPKEALDKLVGGMPAHAKAGQYQQRPTAREGGMFKRVWFDNPVKAVPDPERVQLVRSWDLASGTDQSSDPDYTTGVLMGRDTLTGMLYVIDVIRARMSPGQVERKIWSTAQLDGAETRIRIPQDPGAAGKFEVYHLVSLLQGFSVSTEREQHSKETRAEAFAAQCEHGLVKLVESPWNNTFVEELCGFPNAAHDDQVDAVCAAFRALARRISFTMLAA